MGILAYSEQLQEAFLHLEHARQQEEQRRKESDAVLKGLSLLLSAQTHDEVMQILQQTFCLITNCELCWVLVRQEDRLVDEASNINMPVGKAFARVLRGGVLNAFDVSKIKEWQGVELGGIASALHLPVKLGETTGMLVLCSSMKSGFPSAEIDLVRRLIPFAEQAAVKIIAIEAEHAKEVHVQKKLMQLILDHVPVGIWMLDVDGQMQFVNQNFCAALGVSEQALLAAHQYTDVLNENTANQCIISDQRCFEEKILFNSQESFCNAEGIEHTYDVMKVPVLDANHNLRCLVGIAMDVTDKLTSEREKDEMQNQLLHTQKLESLGVLAGGIAHDFNNILTAIMGHASLAAGKATKNPTAVQDHLQVIVKASDKAADLCKQMLAYSGQGRFIVEPVDVSELIESMVSILGVSLHKGIAFKMQLQTNLPLVEADASQVQQVVMNLITNANEAIGERNGTIAIRTGTMTVDEAYLTQCISADDVILGKHVFIEVSDTGCGMDEATLEKIFDPFFTTKFTGRGLGMSAVLGISRGHKGALKVYSEPEHGTTFRVLFPMMEVSLIQDDAQQGIIHKEGSSTSVLVVDDEPYIQEMAAMMLNEIGIDDVLTAADGIEALEIYQREMKNIRLVLLDLTMPRMDGEETFRQLRRINPDVKVVLSSGYSKSDVVDRFAGKGLHGFIQKPYTSEVLQSLVRAVFD